MFSLILVLTSYSNFNHIVVQRSVDGDTLKVTLGNVPEIFTEMSVRIKGIDTPEKDSHLACERKHAIESKNRLDEIINSQPVQLLDCEADKFFRMLCTLKAGKIDVATQLVKEGYASPYWGETKPVYVCSKRKITRAKRSPK